MQGAGCGIRAKTFAVMESRVMAVLVAIVVLGSIATMVVATVDSLYAAHEQLFFALEVSTVCAFGLEYALRLWTCVEASEYARPWGRLHWMASFGAIVDLLATVPFAILLAVDPGFINGFGVFSVVRVLRVVRLLKIDRFTKASGLLLEIVLRNAELLFVVFLLELTLYIVICSVLHMLGIYPSVPAAMYMGVLLMIGAGTPEEATLSVGGKVVVAFCIYLSVIFFALPTGILGNRLLHCFCLSLTRMLAGSTGIEHTAERLLLAKTASREELTRLVDEAESAPGHVCPNCRHHFS